MTEYLDKKGIKVNTWRNLYSYSFFSLIFEELILIVIGTEKVLGDSSRMTLALAVRGFPE